jgi:hypothetical protein
VSGVKLDRFVLKLPRPGTNPARYAAILLDIRFSA